MYKVWGRELIEENTIQQMDAACNLPNAVGAALMPDAHLGYGLPIGGVLALENAVCPYAVGVDIACRMKLSILDIPTNVLKNHDVVGDALKKGTKFGAGQSFDPPHEHEVLDKDWTVSPVTHSNKRKAQGQLGTSGSGNHFVDVGLLTINCGGWYTRCQDGIMRHFGETEQYVAIMSHSGSRGPGAATCDYYSKLADKMHPGYDKLGWLDMDTQEGQEYWAAMNLMGDYASANHDIIHKSVVKYLGGQVIAGVENHHNFAWKEVHNGREVYVHRKGATPAGSGVLGIIPGSMADYAYVVVGKGNTDSLNSASHGAGRVLSRRKGKEKYKWGAVRGDLLKKGITVHGGGADECPGVYKPIDEVMKHQNDLVSIVARFEPKVVVMCGDGSRAED